MILFAGYDGFMDAHLELERLVESDKSSIYINTLTSNRETRSAPQKKAHRALRQGDIGDSTKMRLRLAEHGSRAVINFAPGSHAHRSTLGPSDFIQTNTAWMAPKTSRARHDLAAAPFLVRMNLARRRMHNCGAAS
jgi:dTDP-glucose 4,6-dehydratase